MPEFIPGPPDSPDNFAGKKSLPSVSSFTKGNTLFGQSWVTIILIVLVLFLAWKYVLPKLTS